MTDPLHVLRAPVTPADPDPVFAARLRARLERAFGLPEGVGMQGTATAISGPPAAAGPPGDRGAAIPYLAVRDARAAIGWYSRVFGGRLRGDPVTGGDGRIGHAELELGGGVLYLAEEQPRIRFVAPAAAGTAVSLVLTVGDLDAVVTAAASEGASLDRGPYEAYGHRNATVRDPFGHRWLLQEPLRARAAAAPRPGDVGYASLWVPDADRAAAFYLAVLGWEYAPGHDPRGRQVPGSVPPQGLWGGQARPTLFCSYVVADAAATAARVRAAGGTAGELVRQPYGLTADCEDDQGLRFAIHQPPQPGWTAGGPAAAARDGDLGYVTLEVPDGARARDFYAAALGWRIERGRVRDGWQVVGTAPLIGISGGHAEAAMVPLWRAGDVAAAVQRVRAAGGTAGEPQPEPYGVVAQCKDDQGTRFQLCQFPAGR
jgi:predicted enzyme related to lactoylglutathione lyase